MSDQLADLCPLATCYVTGSSFFPQLTMVCHESHPSNNTTWLLSVYMGDIDFVFMNTLGVSYGSHGINAIN